MRINGFASEERRTYKRNTPPYVRRSGDIAAQPKVVYEPTRTANVTLDIVLSNFATLLR